LRPPRHYVGMVEGTEDRFHQDFSGEERWNAASEFYGYDPELRMWLRIGSFSYPSLPPEERERLRTRGQQELESLAGRHSLPVWGPAWLEGFTGLKPKPMPTGWESWPDYQASGFAAKYPGKPFSQVLAEWSR